MSKDWEIVSEYNDCYEEAYCAWGSFYLTVESYIAQVLMYENT